jgi:2-iminobutanoate/2-iminopropanoate deaminase
MKRVIATAQAPAAIGPYSQAISAMGFVFVSGQLPIDPRNSTLEADDISLQTRRSLLNVKAILEAAGSGLDCVVKTSVFLRHMGDFAAMNEVYAEFFPLDPPSRIAVEVSNLPRGARVEIEAIACEKR